MSISHILQQKVHALCFGGFSNCKIIRIKTVLSVQMQGRYELRAFFVPAMELINHLLLLYLTFFSQIWAYGGLIYILLNDVCIFFRHLHIRRWIELSDWCCELNRFEIKSCAQRRLKCAAMREAAHQGKRFCAQHIIIFSHSSKTDWFETQISTAVSRRINFCFADCRHPTAATASLAKFALPAYHKQNLNAPHSWTLFSRRLIKILIECTTLKRGFYSVR